MGVGASKIDYKERNFTEQPLEKEEIDVLMKSIPKDDVLGSLNQEDKKMIINNYPVDTQHYLDKVSDQNYHIKDFLKDTLVLDHKKRLSIEELYQKYFL